MTRTSVATISSVSFPHPADDGIEVLAREGAQSEHDADEREREKRSQKRREGHDT